MSMSPTSPGGWAWLAVRSPELQARALRLVVKAELLNGSILFGIPQRLFLLGHCDFWAFSAFCQLLFCLFSGMRKRESRVVTLASIDMMLDADSRQRESSLYSAVFLSFSHGGDLI